MSLRGGVRVHVSDMYKVVGEEGQEREVCPLQVRLQPAAAWARSPPSPRTRHAHMYICARAHTHTPSHRASETMTRGPFLFKDSCQDGGSDSTLQQVCTGLPDKRGRGGRKKPSPPLSLSLFLCLGLTPSITLSLPPQFNADLTAGIILQRRLFADAAELSIRADTQSGSNVTSPHYVNG